MKFPYYKKRVKDLRKRDYGEGEIVGYVNDGEEYWVIRWDNPGLDNEWVEAKEFEFITQAEPEHPGECKDCPKCKHPECRHGFGLCDYARGCACDYYVGKVAEK